MKDIIRKILVSAIVYLNNKIDDNCIIRYYNLNYLLNNEFSFKKYIFIDIVLYIIIISLCHT